MNIRNRETKTIIRMLKAALEEAETSYRDMSYLYENAIESLMDLDPCDLENTAHVLGVVGCELATDPERIPVLATALWRVHDLVRMPVSMAKIFIRKYEGEYRSPDRKRRIDAFLSEL